VAAMIDSPSVKTMDWGGEPGYEGGRRLITVSAICSSIRWE